MHLVNLIEVITYKAINYVKDLVDHYHYYGFAVWPANKVPVDKYRYNFAPSPFVLIKEWPFFNHLNVVGHRNFNHSLTCRQRIRYGVYDKILTPFFVY